MFNPSAPLPPLTTGSRIERSNSRLRKDLLRLVSPQAKSNKSACLTPTASSLPVSTTSTARSFFMKSGKMRSLHRKQKSGDSVLTLAKEDASVVAAPTQQVNHSSQADSENRDSNAATYRASDELAAMDRMFEEDYTSTEAKSAKRNSMFVGLPDYRVGSDSIQNFIDPNFLQRAFGITMEENTENQTFPMLETIDSNKSSDSNTSNNSTAQHQLTGNTTAKDRRPRIHVSIPDKKTQTLASSRNFDGNARGTPGTVSPPSTTTMHQRPFNGVATARLSIISPLSVMEMPKPRRPFSAVSLEGMTAHMPESTSAIPKSRSTSSEDSHNELYEHSSGHSPRSSMSSMVSEPASYKQQDGGRNGAPTPSLAPGLTDRHGPGKSPRTIRSLAPRQGSTPPRSLKNKSSVISLTSTTVVDTNKPLPPEPGQVNVAPLNVVGASPLRSSTITVRQRVATMESGCMASNSSITRRSSKASTLKSKYTPKDLDALDDAFQRNMPLKHQTSRSYTSNSTPTLSEVTLALESQLDTIKEDSPPHSIVVPNVHDPLQISRGPMRMEPSRKAPYPPTQTGSPAQEPRRGTGHQNRSGSPIREPRRVPPASVRNGSPAREPRRAPSPSIRDSSPTFDKYETPPRKRVVKKAASSNHVATQLRAVDHSHRRSSTVVLASSAKANRILGKDGAITPVRIERKESMESNWTPNESPQVYTTSTSPTEGTHTPESELSVPDAHFEEIRKRLELLSPKDDPSLTFLAFHEMNASRTSVKLPSRQEKIGHIFMKTDLHSTNCPSVEHKIEIPNFIAELEATRNPSPVELEDTQRPLPPATVSEKIPLVEIVECPNESNVHPLERRDRAETLSPPPTPSAAKPRSIHHSRSVKARSLASLAMSEIPELYAELPSPKGVNRPSMTAEEVEQLISADAAERVLLRILQSLENLGDLFAAATVSRGFYRTFKRHELSLVKNALWCMSPAAWELREMSVPSGFIDYSPSLYLQHYTRDIYTMVELKSMMLEHCKSFLRPDTIKGLAGETDRSPFIDDAFWRVWTFCRIFGCGRGREDDIVGQMDWLKGGKLAKQQSTDTNTLAISDGVAMNSVLFNPPEGFSRGNRGGLTAEELYDMSEIWTCLGVLVRGYQGFRREAREFGIFERANIATGDVEKENATLGMCSGP